MTFITKGQPEPVPAGANQYIFDCDNGRLFMVDGVIDGVPYEGLIDTFRTLNDAIDCVGATDPSGVITHYVSRGVTVRF